MAINEETRQLEIAREVEALTRTLAHSTRTVPNPSESYNLLAELWLTVDHLQQVSQQLAQWHQGVIDGTHYNGLDGEKYAPENVVPFLHSAAIALGEAYGAIGSAHSMALLQRLAAVRGRLSLCADQAAAAKWWLSMPMASVSAEGPMPKALSTRRTSPLMPVASGRVVYGSR